MHKDKIADLLEEKYHTLLLFLEAQDDDKWTIGPKNKWTTGQHALHLLKNIKPLNDVLSMPRFLFKYTLGTTNREIRDYETIVNSYLQRLEDLKNSPSITSKKIKIPKIQDKRYILTRLQVESKKLQYKIRRISDRNLDTLVLPHPVMGKMPIREILMLTAYHVDHHTKQLHNTY